MRRLLLFVIGTVLAVPLCVQAQIAVQLSMDRDTWMVYESIPVTVKIRNFSGRPIRISGQADAPWLSFLITDVADVTIGTVAKLPGWDAVTLAPGQTVSRIMDLLPYYDLRQRGTFSVRAIVKTDAIESLSAPVEFTVLNGREIWKQITGLPVASGQTNEEYRTYSLLKLRLAHNDVLYVGVEDEARGRVYGMIPLGDALALGEPSAKIDIAGHLHILYRSGPRSYSYAEIDPQAQTVKRMVYSDMLSVPQLVANETGSVTVRGGEQTYPKVQRMMTDSELNPPPPPAPPPKRKWWWPFGPSKSKPATTDSSSVNALQ
ncbi:MAG TPA: hypothetical protein VL171_03940 [Verrucomicrobiae bacterium]|nr:hypothetical protein [Verrucomicrobiae bacterium]